MEPESFEMLLAQYQDKVFRLACGMLGNRALAEETAQDIFVRIWKALPQYRAQASIGTWIYATARNTCLSALRRNAARQALSLDDPSVRLAAEHRCVQPAGQEVDALRLVAQLPEKYRQVVMLYYMEEQSYEEVARRLDLPLGTVKTHLHRARKEIASALVRSRMTEGAR